MSQKMAIAMLEFSLQIEFLRQVNINVEFWNIFVFCISISFYDP